MARLRRSIPALPALPWLALASLGASACAPAPRDRAMALVRQHRDDEAVATLREQLGRDPADHASRRLLVRVLAAKGDLAGARAELDELAKRLPEGDPSPWIELGHALELSHRYDEALAAYDRAGEVAPASPLGPREGGMRAARWGEVAEARPRLEEAVRRGARDGATWHALGLVRVHLKELAAAEEAYRAGIAADPRSAENWLGVATVAVLQHDGRKALEAYDAILERRPGYAPAALGRAWALAALGRREEAARALDRAAELGASPEHVARQRAALSR